MQAQSGFPFDQPVVWTPTPDQIEASNLVAFQRRTGLSDLEALERKAVGDPAWFWNRVLADLDIRFETPWTRILDLSQGKPHARWCVDGRLNITVSCLDKWQAGTNGIGAADPALIWVGEDGRERTLSYGALHGQVEACAAGLRSLGLGAGDSIGIYMPMVPETVIAFLAIIRIGAIALPLFSGFGPSSVADRLLAGRARAAVTVDGYRRRGRWVDTFPVLQSVRSELPDLEHLVLVRTDDPDVEPADVSAEPTVHLWSDLCAQTPVGRAGAAEIMDSEDPCLVIFTSGTTGAPKGNGPHPLRVSRQGRPGHVPRHGRTVVGYHLLAHGSRLDDGTVADLRLAALGRDHGRLRRRPGLARRRSDLGHLCPARGYAVGHIADPGPVHAGPGRGAGEAARPVRPEGHRVVRQSVGSGIVDVGVRAGPGRHPAHPELFRRHRDQRRHRWLFGGASAQAVQFQCPAAGHGGRRGRRARRARARPNRRTGGAQPLDWHDPGFLAGPGRPLPGHLLVRVARPVAPGRPGRPGRRRVSGFCWAAATTR